MAGLSIDRARCDLCGACVAACPFDAIHIEGERPVPNAACRLCRLCVKACPHGAISVAENAARDDKSAYRGIMVFVEYAGEGIHPVAYELIGKARELAARVGYTVSALLIGENPREAARGLRHYGLSDIYVCAHPQLKHFAADAHADAFEAAIRLAKPSAVLVGATGLGRSLAPRVATRFATGLTADCTQLEMKENSDLVQIRPAFGGNLMARIVTPGTRPQFATVHYKVFDKMRPLEEESGIIREVALPERLSGGVQVLDVAPKPPSGDISDAEIIVAVGRGCMRRKNLEDAQTLAKLLGAEMAYSRPLVEKRLGDVSRQIGLSGKTVKAKLIVALGISGAVQFLAGMNACERIIAVNSDADAPILSIAHVGIVADAGAFLPELIRLAGEEKLHG